MARPREQPEPRGAQDAGDEVAQLRRQLDAARRTIDVLVARIEREADRDDPDRLPWRQAIRQLETTVAARSRDLAAREQNYGILYHQSPDAMLTLRGERVVACNRTAQLVFARGAAELIGQPLESLLSPESGAALTSLLWSGFVGVGDAELVVPSGRRLSFSVARLADEEVLVVLRDVTQRRRLEGDLERARHIAGYGRLASELASEITGSLSVVAGRLALLQQKPPTSTSELSQSLGIMSEHCRRMDTVVANLRTLGRPREPRPERILAREMLVQVLAEEAHKLERVRVDIDLPPDLVLLADPEHSSLVLRNLLSFLADHMPRGKALHVRASAPPSVVPELVLDCEGLALPDEITRVLVRRETDRSLAAPDPGRGLGLAIAWTLVRDNGGMIRLEDGGTRLRLRLGSIPTAAEVPRRRTILVVDDDQLLCDTVSWMLSGQGLEVHSANSAEAALRLLASRAFDCIVADLILPGMDGVQLLETARRRWPDHPFRGVLTTGSDREVPESVELLRKPFNREQLLAVVAPPDSELAAGR